MPESIPPPVDAGLWMRLRRFDAHCSIHFSRTEPQSGGPWRALPRVWRSSIRHQEEKFHETAHAEHPEFGEAVRLAVEEAERRGWDRPRLEMVAGGP